MQKLLFEDDFVPAKRCGHPRRRHTLDLDTFCALNHLLISADGGGSYGQIDSARRARTSAPSSSLNPELRAGASILSSTDCVCTMPHRNFSRHAAELDLFRPPPDMPLLQMLALWHSRSQSDQGHAWLREQLYAAVWQAAV